MRQNLFAHIAVAVLQDKLRRSVAVSVVYFAAGFLDKLLFSRKFFGVVVAYYADELSAFHSRVQLVEMEKALVALRFCGSLFDGKFGYKLVGN